MKQETLLASYGRTLKFLTTSVAESHCTIERIQRASNHWQDIGNAESIAHRREWGRKILEVAGMTLVIVNESLLIADRPVIFMVTHTSQLDIPTALAIHPGELRIIAKKQLRWTPYIGKYLREGHFLMNRGSGFAGKRADYEGILEAARTCLERNASLLIFPEGTRSLDGKLRESFTQGGFFAAIRTGMPIQPVALLGTHQAWPKGSLHLGPPGTITAVVRPLIETAGLKKRDWEELANKVRSEFIAGGYPA